MALAAKQSIQNSGSALNENTLFCPMIDARRMEVFTAIYNSSLFLTGEPIAQILDQHSFQGLLANQHLVFSGSGAKKLQAILIDPRAIFLTVQHTANQLALLAHEAFNNKQFANLAYCEPFYGKAFYSPPQKK
jgi:tRNA threonylcarbamoyladenosine biosynthesis protein TsaB